MPIRRAARWGLASLLILMGAHVANAAVLVRSAEQLWSDPGVQNYVDTYRALVAANVVYDKCGEQYGFTDDQRVIEMAMFEDVSKKYVKTYYDAYVNIVRFPPEQTMVDSYLKIIAAQQAEVVQKTEKYITQYGCENYQIQSIANYVQKLHATEMNKASQ